MKRFIRRLLQGRYKGLNRLDRQLETYLDYDGGFFVELGANDGVTQSNSLYFEKYRGWRGVLVEPAPDNFLKCCANRSRATQVFCAACVSFDYEPEFVRITYSNLMSVSQGLESDIIDAKAHADSGRRFLRTYEQTFDFGAVARPLSAILTEARAPKTVDFLSLDVEGAEIEVLKGVNHDEFRFKFIIVECRSLPTMNDFLRGHGYRLIKNLSEHDYLFTSLPE
jgi:FkbM family methyltransferase